MKLSVVLATYNEENNLARCLQSIKDIADEIVIVDGGSGDETVAIAKRFGARIIQVDNPPIFHINKQKALDAAKYPWVLQLDADEVVTPELAAEIREVVGLTRLERTERAQGMTNVLFQRHTAIVEARDGKVGTNSDEIAAYFVARRNYFLGAPIRYAGTFPDGVIRLVEKAKVHFPCKSVHEQIVVQGGVSWLSHDLLHYSNPTFAKYMSGADTYTSLLAGTLSDKDRAAGSLFRYMFVKPAVTFFELALRHKGILDGWRGVLFSLFSGLHFPIAYMKFIRGARK